MPKSWGWGGGPCNYCVSPSPFGLDLGTFDFGTFDFGTFDFGTMDLGLTKSLKCLVLERTV